MGSLRALRPILLDLPATIVTETLELRIIRSASPGGGRLVLGPAIVVGNVRSRLAAQPAG